MHRLLLAAVALILAVGAEAGPGDQASREAGCHPLQLAARRSPARGAAWVELGVCLARRGERGKALGAYRRAAASGSCSARLAAYAALYALGERVRLPPLPDLRAYGNGERTPPSCLAVGGPRCGPYFACTYVMDTSGQGGTILDGGYLFGRSEEALRGVDGVSASAWSDTHGRGFDDRAGAVIVRQESSWEDYCHAGAEERGECCTGAGCSGGERSGCVVVFADACRQRVGLWCKGKGHALVGFEQRPERGADLGHAEEIPSMEPCRDDPQ